MSNNQNKVNELKKVSSEKITELKAENLNIREAMKRGAEKIKVSESSDNLNYDNHKAQIVKNIDYLNKEYSLNLSESEIQYLKNNLSEFLKTKTKFGSPEMINVYKRLRKGFQRYINIQSVENPKLIGQIKKIVQSDIAGNIK